MNIKTQGLFVGLSKKVLLGAGCVGFAIAASTSFAATTLKIANKPLTQTSAGDALPNLMFVLDNSGSMGFSYTPDWVTNIASLNNNPIIFANSAINSQYYNPEIRYTPAIKYDGASYPDQTTYTSVPNDAFGIQSTSNSNLVGNAFYFYTVAGEYCRDDALIDCVTASGPSASYPIPSQVRWCNTSAASTQLATPANGSCRSVREGSYTNIRIPLSTFTITVTGSSGATAFNPTHTISSITVNGTEIMPATSASVFTNDNNLIAANIANAINNCSNNITGNCRTHGFRATRVNNVITVTSPFGNLTNPILITKTGGFNVAVSGLSTVVPGGSLRVNIDSAVSNYPLPGSSNAAPGRTDCTGVCTYAQEMTNYANWHSYYRTRMQGMKTSASQAFQKLKTNFRVGFITINNASSNYLAIDKFTTNAGGQKDKWYGKLFAANPGNSTPLRESLSTVGKIYAGKKPLGSGTGDPVLYECQANYTLLTTDGYWNGGAGSTVNNNAIPNQDGDITKSPRPEYEGPTAAVGSLADVAYYYANTDLRDSVDFNNCSGGAGVNVCGETTDDPYPMQTMKTLTLGLGIDGTLIYDPNYKNQNVGDFAQIKSGSKDWPVPEALTGSSEGPRHIDDLWHAAVNGEGTYFSARDPKSLSLSLQKAISDIEAKVGTGTGASASTLQPTAGDNENLIPSYITVKWSGNIESHPIDLVTLETRENVNWCVETVAPDNCLDGGVVKPDTVAGTGKFFCAYAGSNATACADLNGDLVGTECRVSTGSCTGVMPTQIGADFATESRKIMFYDASSNSLRDFTYANLPTSLSQYFEPAYLSTRFSQWSDLTGPADASSGQRANAVRNSLVGYLRGQFGNEARDSNPAINQIFRVRDTTLGDITDSQPAYLNKQVAGYDDTGYAAYAAVQKNRKARVYVGANDGMLHVFDATKVADGGTPGKEIFAFIPTPLFPKLWRLADRDYAINHANYVNGDMAIADIYDSANAKWRTILVGGLGIGGRGYFAFDITYDPASPNKLPQFLWEYTAANNSNLGYSVGTPEIVKMPNGTWVVLITSGYNNGSLDYDKNIDSSNFLTNTPAGDGKGYLIALNPVTGAVIKTLNTNSGTAANPSGLGQITAYVEDTFKNNTSPYVYGTDLNGDVWRFDLNAATNTTATKLASLVDSGGKAQPITTSPILTTIEEKRAVIVGTGKYIEEADLGASTDIQTLYAFIDNNSSGLGNPRSSLVGQAITVSGGKRRITANSIDYSTKLGWFIDLPTGERQNVDGLTVGGVVFFPTILPSPTSCSPGGIGYLNFVGFKTGASVLASNIVSDRVDAPIVGLNLLFDKDGKPKVGISKANDPGNNYTPDGANAAKNGAGLRPYILELNKNGSGTYGKRRSWREILVE